MQLSGSLMQTVRSSILRSLMLYFSISVLINTSLFPTIKLYMMNDVHFAGQVDSSLLEVMLENLLGMEDAGITYVDDDDDVSATVDYLSTRTRITLTEDGVNDRAKLPRNYDGLADPALQRSTPPPKYLI